MVDEVDTLAEVREREDSFLWKKAQEKAAKIPIGEVGECLECGRKNLPRIVNGHCGRCRDELAKLGIEI
mgnify:CR=1 FL=1